jgi:hypothetical protein
MVQYALIIAPAISAAMVQPRHIAVFRQPDSPSVSLGATMPKNKNSWRNCVPTLRSELGRRLRVAPTRTVHATLLVALAALVIQFPSSTAHSLALVRGPFLQQGTPNSMIVRWRTDLPEESTLRYGPAFNNLSTTITVTGPTTEHEILVESLQPFTQYFYSVGTSSSTLAGADVDHYFVTSREVGTRQPVRIWAIGDSGQKTLKGEQVRDQYLNFAGTDLADVWLMLGDNAYLTGTDSEYTNALFNQYPTILRNTVLWPVPGNHDYQGTPPDSSSPVTETGPYYDAFTLPTLGEAGGVASGTETHYSFDYGNIHFVALNTYKVDVSTSSAVYTWVAADLAATNQDWIIVYNHFPPYSKGSRNSDDQIDMIRMRENFNPLFEQAGVDIVLTGHSHVYERSMMIDGHYGLSTTFDPSHIVDGGDGNPAGDGAYHKQGLGQNPHSGTVYIVSGVGENAHVNSGPLDHPAMVRGFEIEGSTLFDVNGGTLDAYFITLHGDILDRFQIRKDIALPASGHTALVILAATLVAAGYISRKRSPKCQS